eukprot:comp21513_c0_seq1/m.46979 comp21513_c0_seq1/g.46979  ORF comp21513_c0_seq1/g.46979 comp21513_c0_seq1/m.46979 type:complete len:737 (+) comp21513_c0_seq1:131-2341(+)
MHNCTWADTALRDKVGRRVVCALLGLMGVGPVQLLQRRVLVPMRMQRVQMRMRIPRHSPRRRVAVGLVARAFLGHRGARGIGKLEHLAVRLAALGGHRRTALRGLGLAEHVALKRKLGADLRVIAEHNIATGRRGRREALRNHRKEPIAGQAAHILRRLVENRSLVLAHKLGRAVQLDKIALDLHQLRARHLVLKIAGKRMQMLKQLGLIALLRIVHARKLRMQLVVQPVKQRLNIGDVGLHAQIIHIRLVLKHALHRRPRRLLLGQILDRLVIVGQLAADRLKTLLDQLIEHLLPVAVVLFIQQLDLDTVLELGERRIRLIQSLFDRVRICAVGLACKQILELAMARIERRNRPLEHPSLRAAVASTQRPESAANAAICRKLRNLLAQLAEPAVQRIGRRLDGHGNLVGHAREILFQILHFLGQLLERHLSGLVFELALRVHLVRLGRIQMRVDIVVIGQHRRKLREKVLRSNIRQCRNGDNLRLRVAQRHKRHHQQTARMLDARVELRKRRRGHGREISNRGRGPCRGRRSSTRGSSSNAARMHRDAVLGDGQQHTCASARECNLECILDRIAARRHADVVHQRLANHARRGHLRDRLGTRAPLGDFASHAELEQRLHRCRMARTEHRLDLAHVGETVGADTRALAHALGLHNNMELEQIADMRRDREDTVVGREVVAAGLAQCIHKAVAELARALEHAIEHSANHHLGRKARELRQSLGPEGHAMLRVHGEHE